MICIDLSRLFFALRSLKVDLNYEKAIQHIRVDPKERVVGYTVSDKTNTAQTKFLKKLRELGVEVHEIQAKELSNDERENISFTSELLATWASTNGNNFTVVSDDPALARIIPILLGNKVTCRVAFFSEALSGPITTSVVSGEIDFIDFSNPAIKTKVTGR